jgi:hypothetical protein
MRRVQRGEQNAYLLGVLTGLAFAGIVGELVLRIGGCW